MEDAKESVVPRRRPGRPKRTVSGAHPPPGTGTQFSAEGGETNDRRRIQLDLSLPAIKELDKLQAETGFSRADTIRVALAVLKHTCEKQRQAGEEPLLPTPRDFQ